MLSNIRTFGKAAPKKTDCTCVSIKLDDRRKGDPHPPEVDIECSSHPGFCVLDDRGVCTKRGNAVHCAEVALKSLAQTFLLQPKDGPPDKADTKSCERQPSNATLNSGKKKFRLYKIDLNNSKDTGLACDKQCKSCGPECSKATCSSRAREYFISWDTIRMRIFFVLSIAFLLWLGIYAGLSLTSSL